MGDAPSKDPRATGAGAGRRNSGDKSQSRASAIYQALFNNMPVPLHAVDEETRLTEVNDAWLTLFGYSREEVIGHALPDFYTAESAREFHERGWPELLEKGEFRDVERQLRCKSGAIVTVLLSSSIERDGAGKFLRGYGVLVDISARRKLERERERYFEMAQDFLAIAGFDGALHDINPAIAAAAGLSREQILATPFFEFLHPDDRPDVEASMAKLAAGAAMTDVEVRYRHRDGNWHWSAWRSTAMPEESVIFSVGRDIEERRQAEELLRRAERLDAIGQLTGGIAHDFNNLLTIVIGNLDRIAQSRTADERIKRLAEVALQGAERGARLTEHLQAFARRQRLEPQPLALDELLARMEPLYQRAVGETVRLELALAPGLWRCRADPGRLETAILNLILNARDATESGGSVTVSAANRAVASGEIPDVVAGDYLEIAVRDSGAGMPEDVLARAFEPFFSTRPVGKGAGLGLSMVYGFARQSGGAARIESRLGAGTVVRLYLPRAEGEAAPGEAADAGAAPAPGGALSVLVVEDEVAVREMTAEVLKELGHRVLVAENGPEALALLEREARIDLLISDVVMPGGMSGVALASRVREIWPGLPVLLVTGYGFAADGGMGRHGFAVLRKPYRPSQLTAKMDEVLGGARPGD